MRKLASSILLATGILFVLYAIFGRYIVLPGYFATLENGNAQNGAMPSNTELWKIVIYLLWAFSFKLGIFFITIGSLLKTKMKKQKLVLFIVLGILYILTAYAPIPGPISLLFGIGGGIMTVLIIFTMHQVSKERDHPYKNTESAVDGIIPHLAKTVEPPCADWTIKLAFEKYGRLQDQERF